MRLSTLVEVAEAALAEHGDLLVCVPEPTCPDCDQGAYIPAEAEVGTVPVWAERPVSGLRFLVH